MRFLVDECDRSVGLRVGATSATVVLTQAPFRVGGDSCVDRTVPTQETVDVPHPWTILTTGYRAEKLTF